MNRLTLSVIALSALNTTFAQKSVSSSGGDASGAGGSISYTIGQIDYINQTSATGNINQGVQQPYEFFVELGIEENQSTQIQIYPNPSTDFIVLEIESIQADMSYELFDSNGKLVASSSIDSEETSIEMKSHSPGTYFLNITQAQNKIRSIKIIKH